MASSNGLGEGHELGGSLEHPRAQDQAISAHTVAQAKAKFAQKRNSKLMQKNNMDDYQEIF